MRRAPSAAAARTRRLYLGTMRRSLPLTLALALAACASPRSAAAPPPPAAEFLLSAGDSTFWVKSGENGLHTRGAPLVLARYGGRFYEVYTVDDDHSYEDALFLGEWLYSRDIARDDSTLVLADSTVPRMARQYGRDNPDARRLAPDDDGPDDPPVSATATIDFLDVYGPYLSYRYHLDTDTPETGASTTSRRGVVDLRASGTARLADLVGAAGARAAIARARAAVSMLEDSIRAARDARAERAVEALGGFRLDERSFALTTIDRAPAVSFDVPGSSGDAEGLSLPIPPVRVDTLPEWPEIRPTVPTVDDDGNMRWSEGRYAVVARPDSTGDLADIAIADSAGHEWPVATVTGPVERLFTLDRPAVSREQRLALGRAFDEAALYDEDTRTASARVAPHRGAELAARRAKSPATARARGTPRKHSRHRSTSRPRAHA